MDLSAKGKMIAACNWLMAASGMVVAIFMFALIFSVPPDSDQGIIQQAAVASVPQVAPNDPTVPKTTANTAPALKVNKPTVDSPAVRGATSTAIPRALPIQASPDAPVAKGPGHSIPALNPATLPPGVGKDF